VEAADVDEVEEVVEVVEVVEDEVAGVAAQQLE